MKLKISHFLICLLACCLFSNAYSQVYTCGEGGEPAKVFTFDEGRLLICGNKVDVTNGGEKLYQIFEVRDKNEGHILATYSGRNNSVIYLDNNGITIIELLQLPSGPDWQTQGNALFKQTYTLEEGDWKVSGKEFLLDIGEMNEHGIEEFVQNEVKDFSGILADNTYDSMMRKLLVGALRGNYRASEALWNFERHFGRELDYQYEVIRRDFVSYLQMARN